MKVKKYQWLAMAAFAVVALVMFAAAAMAQEEEDAFGNIMNTAYVSIEKVDFTAPAAGAPCKVAVKLTPTAAEDFEDYKIKSAKLSYVVNGDRKGLKSVDMAGNGGTYTAEIPGQAAGSKIAFFVRVEDSLGNVSTEAIPVDKMENAPDELVAGVADMNNSKEIVPDSTDILDTLAGYDKDYIYAAYKLEADAAGGTIDPPSINVYGLKFTNPDIEQNEGFMVGKLWLYLPLAKDKAGQDAVLHLLSQAGDVVSKTPKDQLDFALKNGSVMLDITKLLANNWNEGLLFSAMPQRVPTADSKLFIGAVKRSTLGDNPSGFYRMIALTLINNSLDSLMPMPMNCSHFMQIYTRDHEYEVK